MKITFALATTADAAAIATLRTATTRHLLEQHGRGPWKGSVTEKGVLLDLRTSRVLMARLKGELIAVLSLTQKKPWAIDPAYFTKVAQPVYLINMAVSPEHQRLGVGRQMLEEARTIARQWPGDAIRLDAYANETGAGGFYAKCGYREVGRVTYRQTPLIYFEALL